jgi:DNA polymerase III alpha subunit (gram-positive type)
MQDNLLRFKKDQKYLIFDTETESLSLVLSRPWQLSWSIAVGDKIVKNEDRFIHWDDLQISDGAAKITRFDRQRWESKSEEPTKVLNDFDNYLYNPEYLIIGANLFGFDIYQHNNIRRQLGLKTDYSYINRIIDVQALQKGIYLGLKSVPENRTAWHYQMQNFRQRGVKTSVKHLCSLYEIPYDENRAHDAVYDNHLVFSIFKKQIFTIEV